MIGRISNALLRRILYPVTAVAALDGNGRVLRVDIFDSQRGIRRLNLGSRTRSVAFISSHPTGWRKLDAQDKINLARVAELSQGLPVRVYLCSEEFASFEVDRAEFCDIMERPLNRKAESMIENGTNPQSLQADSLCGCCASDGAAADGRSAVPVGGYASARRV